jgi:hypothetical protein
MAMLKNIQLGVAPLGSGKCTAVLANLRTAGIHLMLSPPWTFSIFIGPADFSIYQNMAGQILQGETSRPHNPTWLKISL